MIGIAFDPDFASNNYVYFYYTGTDERNRLVRFNGAGDVGTDGPTLIYSTNYLYLGLHVGGGLGFGPVGKLYLGIGDNGDPSGVQNLSLQNGKILRINSAH